MIFDDLILENRISRFLRKGSGRAILFINIKKELSRKMEMLKRCLGQENNGILIVFLSMLEMPRCAHKIGFEKILSEDCLSVQDYQDINDHVFTDMARNWYISCCKASPHLEYEGTNLGSLVEYEFGFFLIPLIKNLEAVKKIVQSHKPGRIVSMEDTGHLNPVVKLIAEESGIPALALSCNSGLFSLTGLVNRLSAMITTLLSNLMDLYMRQKALKSDRANGCIFVNHRLFNPLVSCAKHARFMRVFLANDFRARYRALKKGEIYFPFFLYPGGRPKKEWRREWKRVRATDALQNTFNYKGTSYWSLVEKKINYFYKVSFPRIVRNIDLLREFNSKRKIKIVVLRTDLRESEKTLVMAAKGMKIPTLLVQHGILGDINGHKVINCDKAALWDHEAVKWYVNFGNPEEKCAVTGSLLFDILYGHIQGKARVSLYGLMDISDAVINIESTAGLEALILNKPLININLSKRDDFVSFVETGAALGVYNPQDLRGAINKILEDETTKEGLANGRNKLIAGCGYKIDGLSCKRVMDLIESMIEGQAG